VADEAQRPYGVEHSGASFPSSAIHAVIPPNPIGFAGRPSALCPAASWLLRRGAVRAPSAAVPIWTTLSARCSGRSACLGQSGERVWLRASGCKSRGSAACAKHGSGSKPSGVAWCSHLRVRRHECTCSADCLAQPAALEWSSSRRLGHRRCASHFGPLAVYLFFHPAVPRPYSVFDAYPACHVPAARVANGSSGPGRRDEPARAGTHRWHCQCGTSTKRLAATLTCSTSCWPRSRR
jgi:hypothetical protein